MGNAESDAAEAAAMGRVESLRDHLADMDRTVRSLIHRPQIDVLLPHETRVFGHVVACDDGVRVLLGPVVGKVDATTARVLLEVDRATTVACHVLIYDIRMDAWAEVPQCRVINHATPARRPTVFRIGSLLPGRQYRVVFSGVHHEDATTNIASFHTPTLANGGALRCAVVSGDDVYELEAGEPSLWRELHRAVVDEQRVQLVIHLGGQVAMKRVFDKAWALLVRHAECGAPPIAMPTTSSNTMESADAATAFTTAWATLEGEATEILRSAYRSQWTLQSAKASVLANASNLMLWSDWDVYPSFTTSPVFAVDHNQPTLEIQVLRTVVRCARRLYQEYQRALWDDEFDQVITAEAELRRIAEQALAVTARIYHLSHHQIPTAQSDLELQKKRREIEGARKAERHVRALETEKSKCEKMLVSFNQLLAPQAGQEFFYRVGDVGFLFIDMRSARVEAGGSQRAENDVLSNVQWASIETVLEDETLQLLLVCSESPVADDVPHEIHVKSRGESECDFKTWWGANADAQQRLLGLLFEWKLQREGRDAVFFSGSSNTRFSMKTVVRDTRLRTDLTQWMVGPITARTSDQFISSRAGKLFDRFAFEHAQIEAVEKCLLYLEVNAGEISLSGEPTTKTNSGLTVKVTRVDGRAIQNPARVLLGPIVGHVDAMSAMVLLEIDRSCDLVCAVVNVLTGERHRVFQHFVANRPNAFFLNHLRAEHFYEISIERIENASQYRCSFTTLARMPSQYQLLVVGSMESRGHANTTQLLAQPLVTSSVWPWIHENVSTGIPFRGVEKMIHFQENTFGDDTVPLQHLVRDEDEASDDREDTRNRIMAKVREAQRLQWNMPGVCQVLAHGSHLILMEESNSETAEDGKERIVEECVTQVRLEYENLLLPPSKRVSYPDQRLENPLRFVFGGYGLFVLPRALTKTTGSCDSFWHRFDEFLKTPLLSFVAILSSRPIIEDSVEDVEEKGRFDNTYRHTLAFHQEKLGRLLDLLFTWQQRPPPGRNCDRRVVFVSGHHSRSFDSILRDLAAHSSVPRPPDLCQFVVGPFHQPNRAAGAKDTSLQMNVFPQGTLFGKYEYYHRVQRRSDEEHQQSGEQDETDTLPSALSELCQVYSGLLHLQAILTPTVDDRSVVQVIPTLIVSSSVVVVPPPSATVFNSDNDLRIQVVGPHTNEPRWALETRHPEWLNSVISQPLSDQEGTLLSELKSVLDAKAADIEISFQRADQLAKGLVSADDRTSFVTHLQAAIDDFHKHTAGMVFRTQYPVIPSAYVINFTLQEMAAVEGQPGLSGAIDVEQFGTILIQCFQKAALFDARLKKLWS